MAQVMEPYYVKAVDYAKTPAPISPALPAAAYAGGYRSDLFGVIAVVETDGGLTLELGPRRDRFALRHFDRDVFTYQPVGENAFGPSAVTFTVGADRKAASVTLENLDANGQGRFDRAPG